jgi:hypothetical protein
MVGGNASTLWDPSILFAYLVLIHGWICQVARLYWLSGILDLPVSFTREAETPPLVWLSAVLRVPKCLRVCFQSAVRVNGTQSRVTSTVTGSMPLGHRCAELIGGLVAVWWRESAFWSPGTGCGHETHPPSLSGCLIPAHWHHCWVGSGRPRARHRFRAECFVYAVSRTCRCTASKNSRAFLLVLEVCVCSTCRIVNITLSLAGERTS